MPTKQQPPLQHLSSRFLSGWAPQPRPYRGIEGGRQASGESQQRAAARAHAEYVKVEQQRDTEHHRGRPAAA